MNKHLAFPILVVVCICFSAHSKVSDAGSDYLNIVFGSNDTIKVVSATDSANAETDHTHALNTNADWLGWKTVDNYAFGKDRGQIPMIADVHSLHPFFRDKIIQLIKNCKAKGIELAVVESYRTHAKQSEYYGMGRKYTRSAGGKSKHQYGLAVDLVPMIDSVAQWDNVALWRKVGVEGEKLGLRWGGRWKSPYDPAHFEWSGGLTTTQLSAGALPPIPATKVHQYPCLKDDIKALEQQWEFWELEQSLLLKRASLLKKATTQKQ